MRYAEVEKSIPSAFVRSVFGKNSQKVLGVETDQMIRGLAPDGPVLSENHIRT
jgi:hypothetical protein